MRTDAPVPEHPAPPSSPASPQRIRLIDRITAYRQPIGLVFTLLLFGLALVATTCYGRSIPAPSTMPSPTCPGRRCSAP